MERMLDIHKVLTESRNESFDNVLSLFSGLNNFKEHDNRPAKTLVSHITCSLNSETSRYEGLLHLKAFLPKCSNEILLEKGIAWMVSCIKACQNDELSVMNLAYLTLASLLQSMSVIPELNNMISNHNISKVIQSITEKDTALSKLYCLEVCMKMYPGICGLFKSIIEKFLLEFLQEDDVWKVKLSAKCYHLLFQVGGSGMKGTAHKVAWEQQYRMTIGSLHTLLDVLYGNVMESILKPDEEPSLNLPISDLPTNPILQMMQLSKKFANLCYLLQVMLTEPFPVSKRVQPDLILCLICRGLGVTGKSLGRVSTDNMILNGFLPTIHICLFKTLNALLFCLSGNMLCYAEKICNIICRSLKWTHQAICEGNGCQYRNIRMVTYESLIQWLRLSDMCSGVELHVDDIAMNLLHDILPQKSTFSIQEEISASKSNKKEHFTNRVTQAKNKWQLCHSNGSERLCSLALQCLRSVLFSSGIFLNSDIHKIIQTSTADLLLKIQRGQFSQTAYRNCDCRCELYNVFIALVLNPCSTLPPPTQIAIQIFSRGQSESDQKIKQNCVEMLSALKRIMYTNSVNKERIVRNEICNEVESHSIRHVNVIENADMNINKKLIIAKNSFEQAEIPEITSSQGSVETVILEPLETGNAKLNGPDFMQKEDLFLNKLRVLSDKSHKNDVLPLSEEIPSKRLKFLEDDEKIVSLQQNDISTQAYESMNKEKLELVSEVDVTICQSENKTAQSEGNETDIGSKHDNHTDIPTFLSVTSEDRGNLTIDDMLSTFVSEPNDIL